MMRARPRPIRGLGAEPDEDLEGKEQSKPGRIKALEQTKITFCFLDLLLKAQAPGVLSSPSDPVLPQGSHAQQLTSHLPLAPRVQNAVRTSECPGRPSYFA